MVTIRGIEEIEPMRLVSLCFGKVVATVYNNIKNCNEREIGLVTLLRCILVRYVDFGILDTTYRYAYSNFVGKALHGFFKELLKGYINVDSERKIIEYMGYKLMLKPDLIIGDKVIELKFKKSLKLQDILQVSTYGYVFRKEAIILWIRNDKTIEIRVSPHLGETVLEIFRKTVRLLEQGVRKPIIKLCRCRDCIAYKMCPYKKEYGRIIIPRELSNALEYCKFIEQKYNVRVDIA